MAVPWHLSSGRHPNSRWQWCLCTRTLPWKLPSEPELQDCSCSCTDPGEPHPLPHWETPETAPSTALEESSVSKVHAHNSPFSDGTENPLLLNWTWPLLLLWATSGRRTLAGGQVRRSGNNNSILYLFLGTSQYFYILKKKWLLRYFTLFKSLQRP